MDAHTMLNSIHGLIANHIGDGHIVNFNVIRGEREVTTPGDSVDNYEPTNALTIIISVNGGATTSRKCLHKGDTTPRSHSWKCYPTPKNGDKCECGEVEWEWDVKPDNKPATVSV